MEESIFGLPLRTLMYLLLIALLGILVFFIIQKMIHAGIPGTS